MMCVRMDRLPPTTKTRIVLTTKTTTKLDLYQGKERRTRNNERGNGSKLGGSLLESLKREGRRRDGKKGKKRKGKKEGTREALIFHGPSFFTVSYGPNVLFSLCLR